MATPSFNFTNFITTISTADTTQDGWNVSDVDTDIKVEGTGAHYDAIRTDVTFTYTFGSSQDMSDTNTHLKLWFMFYFSSYLDTKTNGGVQLWLSDNSNTAYWYVDGSDTYKGGWALLQADISATPDSGTTPSLTAITKFGFKMTFSSNARNVDNTYWDLSSYGIGYEFYGGSSSDKITLGGVTSADTGTTSDYNYGVLQKILGGAIYASGGLFIGDGASTNNTYFDGTNETLIFYANNEKTGLFKIVGTGNGTGSTYIDFSGSLLSSASSQFLFDMTGTNVTGLTLDGTTIDNASKVKLKASGQSGSVFKVSGSGALIPNGATLDNVTINDTSESSTGALEILNASDLNNLDTFNFTNFSGKYAVYIPASVTGTITLDNFQSDGSGTDIYWAGTSGTLTVNKSNGTNFSTNASAGGTVSIVSSVSIAVHVEDQSGSDVSGAYVYVDEDLDVAGSIENTTTDANGDVSTSYSGSATDAVIRVRKYGYKPFITSVSLAGDSSTNVTLITDPQQI